MQINFPKLSGSTDCGQKGGLEDRLLGGNTEAKRTADKFLGFRG